MPGFESIIGQDRPIRILKTFLQTGTIPHAILLTGIEGVGKQSAAIAFAMAANCTGDVSGIESERESNGTVGINETRSSRIRFGKPCGVCRSCRKIESGNHPDVISIKPSGVFIKIDQIRTLCRMLTMKPYEAAMRVVVISDAQAMNAAAGNALLKVLEEPPDGTILILAANHPSELLPTIVSRCRHIRFSPLSGTDLETVLVRSHGLEPGEAKIIASMAEREPFRALHMYEANWIGRRNWLIGELDSLSSASMGRLLAFGEQLANLKDTLPDALEVMKSWLRDLIIEKLCPGKIIHRDLAAEAQQISQKWSLSSLLMKIETIQSTQNCLQAGTNLRLAMEAMILKLSRI